MPHFYREIGLLFLCAAFVLTSTQKADKTQDIREHGTPESSSNHFRSITEGDNAGSDIVLEGGPPIHPSTLPSSKLSASSSRPTLGPEKGLDADVHTGTNGPKQRNVTARKGVNSSKISARKGAPPDSPSSTSSDEEISNDKMSSLSIAPKETANSSSSNTSEKSITIDTDADSHKSNSSTDKSADRKTSINQPLTGSVVKKHKPKPQVTIGEGEIDEPIPATPTKSPPLGMPRKIDYIVPVVITIVALPLLAVVSIVLYKRGRDCWDKRHYRRMDFLIDGMYND